jgi:hypothetical protein
MMMEQAAKIRSKAQNMRSFTLGAGTEDELVLRLRPVLLADVLERTNSLDPGAFKEFAANAGEDFNVFREFAEDSGSAKDALATSMLIRDGYLVLGVEGPIRVIFDTETPTSENQVPISELVATYGDEIDELDKRIKRISGIRGVTGSSKSNKK